MKADDLKPLEDPNIIRSGRLNVGDGHEIYWVDWGNKAIENPIFYVHGGPGEGFDTSAFARFDPTRNRVIFHDQRGSGRSTPFASTDHNTTQDLVSDITKLRQELGFDKISLWGRSWGSTLSLMYAIEHPEAIEKMLIGGIFLARKADNDFYLRGKIASHFPEVWEKFLSLVPENERDNPADYYKRMMASGNPDERKKFAQAWMNYEGSTLSLDYRPEKYGQSDDFAFESLAYLEAHYILNDSFIAENYIINNAHKLKDIDKIVIVHGRYDFICMPSAAYELKNALNRVGDNTILQIVAAGHSGSDTTQREVIRAYQNLLW